MKKNSNTRLLLFDIDGTLLSTHGIPRMAMERVLQKRYNNFNYDNDYNYSGRTDWEIIEHLLKFAGIEFPGNYEYLEKIFSAFAVELEAEIKNGLIPLIYPNVLELLKRLKNSSKIKMGLLTGNIAKGAQLKLESAGMLEYFPLGAFGDDAKERNKLADIAIKRAKNIFGNNINKKNTWIIGDSIYDIRCAKVNRLPCLAVCTGLTSRKELEKEKPDYIVDDFSNLDYVLNILNK